MRTFDLLIQRYAKFNLKEMITSVVFLNVF
jgi:hypothetical protein